MGISSSNEVEKMKKQETKDMDMQHMRDSIMKGQLIWTFDQLDGLVPRVRQDEHLDEPTQLSHPDNHFTQQLATLSPGQDGLQHESACLGRGAKTLVIIG